MRAGPIVDPESYRDPTINGVVFATPSGSFRCGVIGPAALCETMTPVAGEDCERGPLMVSIQTSGTDEMPVKSCGRPSNYGALDPKVLPYGSSLRLAQANTTCVSRETGVTCTGDHGHGFTIAREGLRTF